MAGKRQHYIPRLLQRGFLHASNDEGERTWLHRRETPARLVGIRDVGVEDWFYSHKSVGGASTLDDAITQLENDLAVSIAEMRRVDFGDLIDSGRAARAVSHLVIRTNHLRQLMSTAMSSMLSNIESMFTSPDRLGDMFGLNTPNIAPEMLAAIRKSMSGQLPSHVPTAFAERLLAFEMREVGRPLVEKAATAMGPIFGAMLGNIEKIVRDSHNVGLSRTMESENNGWADALSKFRWVIEYGENFILPDAVALAAKADALLAPIMFANATETKVVVIPLSANQLMVGRASDSPLFDKASFNEQAAACCEAFFISKIAVDDSGLANLIGSRKKAMLNEIVSGAISKAQQARLSNETNDLGSESPEFVQQSFSYQVVLADFGDEILAEEYASILRGVISTLAADLPLHILDGVTIAIDYAGALAKLDRGDPALPAATTFALEYGSGVVKSVTVVRNGNLKEHLVVSAGLAATWLTEDADTRALGLHTLVSALAGVGHAAMHAKSHNIRFKPDTMAAELHIAVAAAPAHYWCARYSSFIYPGRGECYAQLVLDSLAFARREIGLARERIAETGDIHETTALALSCVSAILGHVADWLGHRDGLTQGEAFAGDDLPEQMKVFGLDKWLEIFARDLSACYGPDNALNLGIATKLSPHVERIFWCLGIYCWPENDGVRCIVTDRAFAPPVPNIRN